VADGAGENTFGWRGQDWRRLAIAVAAGARDEFF